MELTALGFDDWFAARSVNLRETGYDLARVTAVDRGAYLVRTLDTEIYAELAGKVRFVAAATADLPCVGDWVSVQTHASGGPATIHGVLPRKTSLHRKCSGKTVEHQMIAANIDVALIVQACQYDFNIQRLDRYLAMANEGQIEPRIVLTKADLISPLELEQMMAQITNARIPAQILAISNTSGAGLDAFQSHLAPGKTYCLLGSSGVGKTTLINRLLGHDSYDTRTVSGTGEGVHTTARRQLVRLECGAMMIDTPGMRELGLLGTTDGVNEAFVDLHDLELNCRFTNCTHRQEPGCALLSAVEAGDLSVERHQNYLKLKQENKFHDLSYAGKREKDRSFGRFIKSAKKNPTSRSRNQNT